MMTKTILPVLMLALLTLISVSSVSALGGSNCFNFLKKRRRIIKQQMDENAIRLASFKSIRNSENPIEKHDQQGRRREAKVATTTAPRGGEFDDVKRDWAHAASL